MDRLPCVSVVLIFLNGEMFLGDAIRSVMAQEFRSFELLLVDDGSDSQASTEAKAWRDRFPDQIRYLEHPGHANRGMSASRNLGMRQARGEYIALIDSDDVWRTGKLSDQVGIMARHPELGLVCGAVNYWRSWSGGADEVIISGRFTDTVIPPPQAAIDVYPLGDARAPCPSDLFFRRSASESVGGFEEEFHGPYEDQPFLAKMYLNFPVYFSSKIWIDYRQHDESCMAQTRRAGKYNEVRQYYLGWFGSYLKDQQVFESSGVRAALARAEDAYRRPFVTWWRRKPRQLRNLATRTFGRLGIARP